MAILQAVTTWLTSNTALVVAVCALFVAGYQASATRRHKRLSVRPHVVVTAERLYDGPKACFVVKLRNNGLGPAIIRGYEALLDGKPFNTKNTDEVATKVRELAKRQFLNFRHFHLASGDAFAKDQEVVLLNVELPLFIGDVGNKVLEPFERLSTRIAYESVYGEKFAYDSDKAGQ